MRTYLVLLLIGIVPAVALAVPTDASPIFTDDFNTGPSSLWGNESGTWFGTGGGYDASGATPPVDYSSLPFALTDFEIAMDVTGTDDGGVFLRSEYNGGAINGVLLVMGGNGGSGTGFYWHEFVNGASGPILSPGGLTTDPVHVRVTVVGNLYSLYLNGSATPATTLTSSLYSSGQVALYDNGLDVFDNIVLSAIPPAVPVPAVGPIALSALIALILASSLAATRRDRRLQGFYLFSTDG
jgi:hypothetical protein